MSPFLYGLFILCWRLSSDMMSWIKNNAPRFRVMDFMLHSWSFIPFDISHFFIHVRKMRNERRRGLTLFWIMLHADEYLRRSAGKIKRNFRWQCLGKCSLCTFSSKVKNDLTSARHNCFIYFYDFKSFCTFRSKFLFIFCIAFDLAQSQPIFIHCISVSTFLN